MSWLAERASDLASAACGTLIPADRGPVRSSARTKQKPVRHAGACDWTERSLDCPAVAVLISERNAVDTVGEVTGGLLALGERYCTALE
jgi:hypothetical protein